VRFKSDAAPDAKILLFSTTMLLEQPAT